MIYVIKTVEFFRESFRKLTDKETIYNNLTILIFVFVTVYSIFYFKFPPILDYPNHYARIWLISGGINSTPFKDIYNLDWSQAHTNIAIDLLAATLGKIIGADILSKLLLFLAITLPPCGIVILQRHIFQAGHPWQLFSFLVAWNTTLIGGFINFNIGLGLAFLFASLELRFSQRSIYLRILIRLAAGLVLCLTHLFALVFGVILFASLTFGKDFSLFRSLEALKAKLLNLISVLLPIVLPSVLLMASARSLPGAHRAHNAIIWSSSFHQLSDTLLTPFSTYAGRWELLFFLPVLALISWAIVKKQLQIHVGLAIGALSVYALASICPLHMMGTGWVAWRFPIMAALLGFSAICPLPNLTPPQHRAILAVAILSLAFRTAFVLGFWFQGRSDVSDVLTVLEHIPAGAKVLPVEHELDWADRSKSVSHRYYMAGEDTFRNLPALAIPKSHAFVPTLFTAKGKQPVVLREPWTHLAAPESPPASIAVLSCRNLLTGSLGERQPYLYHWRQNYDYVLVINASSPDRFVGNLLPPGLQQVSSKSFASLYRIIDRSEGSDSSACPR